MSSGAPGLLLCGLALVAIACGPEHAAERGGESDDRRIGPGMMARMMENMPEGLPASALPEPASPGARLVARYCAQCHGIPTPRRLSAVEWPSTLRRMFARMERMQRMGGMMEMMREVEVPSATERETILDYLQAHALRELSPEQLPTDDPAARLFAAACSRCHALPDPAQHTADEWAAVVRRMRENMRRMGVEDITDAEARAITGYLQSASAPEPLGSGRHPAPPVGGA